MTDVDALAQEIRRVDGSNSLGAGQLAEALAPFIDAALYAERKRAAEIARELFTHGLPGGAAQVIATAILSSKGGGE